MLRSAAHETYHFVENYSAKDAADLRDYVIDALKGKGVNIDEALKKYAEQGPYDTREKQISELVADSMFDVFSNEDFIKDLTAKNQTLVKRLANKIGEWVKEIRSAIKLISVRGNNPEIKALMDDAEKLDTIRNMLLKGYKNAGENFKAEQAKGQKNNAVKMTTDKSSGIIFSKKESYDTSMQNTIDGYLEAVDEDLLSFVQKYYNNPNEEFDRLPLTKVSPKQAKDLKALLGVDFSEYSNAINKSAVNHVNKRHGKNGEHDNSMSNINDFARLNFIIDNYDEIEIITFEDGDFDLSKEFRNSDNTPAKLIRMKKKVNGTFYVVEAVPENKYKKIWVASAYIQKNGAVTQVPTTKSSGSSLVSPDSTISIPETRKSVKQNLSRSDAEYLEVQKQKQLDIINETNPAPNTYSTWIRTVDDIKTLAETLEDDEWDYEEFNPDLTREDIQNAIESGEITVYSSYPIENGVFVSPSRMEAESYSRNGNIYEETVDINDVAWIDPTQGQYAKADNGQVFSQKQTDPIQANYAEVMRENRNLKNIISALDEMQYSSARSNIHLDGRDIHNIAGRLLKSASSKYELKAFEDELTAVYDYMANGGEVDTEAVFQSILGIANRVLEKSEMKDNELYDQYKDVREFLKSQPIYITPSIDFYHKKTREAANQAASYFLNTVIQL